VNCPAVFSSLGLAAPLIGVEILLLRTRDLFEMWLERAHRFMSVASAGVILAMGVFVTARGAARL
jgi:hypothetical protein